MNSFFLIVSNIHFFSFALVDKVISTTPLGANLSMVHEAAYTATPIRYQGMCQLSHVGSMSICIIMYLSVGYAPYRRVRK
jgi:hypothetical protein